MGRPLIVMCSVILGLTVLLFPSSQPGKIINLSSGEILASTSVLTLSPVLSRFSRMELYSIVLSPRLDSYAENISSSEQIALVKSGVKMGFDGRIISEWSFEWFYWVLVDILPSAIIGFIVWWRLRLHNADRLLTEK